MAKTKNKFNKESLNNMMSLNKKTAGKIVALRIVLIILTDIVVLSLFDFVRGEGMRELMFHKNVLPYLSYIFPALFLLSAVYFVVTVIKKFDTSAHIMTPTMITALTIYLSLTVLFYDRFRISPFLFYTMTIIASVLFAVYYIYTIILYKK